MPKRVSNKLRQLNRPLLAVAGAALVLNLATWAVAGAFPHRGANAILHYTSRVGIDFVGEGRHIMVLPTVGLVTLAANLMVGWLIMKTDHRTAWVLWGAAPIIQVFLIVAIVFLWSVNG